MIKTNKSTSLILFIVTLCLSATIGYYAYSMRNYVEVEADVIYISSVTNPRNSNVDYEVLFEYSMNNKDYEGTICVSNINKYEKGKSVKIWVNSNNPIEINDNTFYRYLLPIFAIVVFMDALVVKDWIIKRKNKKKSKNIPKLKKLY